MSVVIIREGDWVTQDPADAKVYQYDWNEENLASGAIISTNKVKITAIRLPERVIASVTRSSTTATVTTTAAHKFASGDLVTISGATQTDYNGTFSITVTGARTFTYTVSGSPDTPATTTTELMAALVVEIEVSSITRSSSTATVTTTAAHGYATGDDITIAGAVPDAYNGLFEVTVTGATTFTYTVSGSPDTPATGAITASSMIDEVSLLTASPYNSRWTQFRLSKVRLGSIVEISNRITTNETVTQTKERSFRVSGETR